MSNVKIYTAVSEDLSPLIQGEGFCVDMVRYRDYAALEAKCAALAAENAEMRSSIDATIGWQESTDPENGESVRMLVDIKTTATNAFLAEVQAQGVEMAMEHMQSRGSLTFGDCYISLNEFAAQLRQEPAQ